MSFNKLPSYNASAIGRLPVSSLIILTAALLLIWAFGSYILYAMYDSAPRMCFPPISGCASISLTGMSKASGVFYRALILPTAPLVGITFLFGIRFLKQVNPSISRIVSALLFCTGVVLCPLFLIIAEAILNGTLHTPYLKAHIIFSELAFLMPVIYLVFYSFQLLRTWQHYLVKFMCVLAVISVPCYIFMLTHIIPIQRFSTTMEWDLFIVLNIWIILMGVCIKKYRT